MKQKLFRWLQTFLVIISLAGNLLPSVGTVAASAPSRSDSSDDTDNFIGQPRRDGPESPARGPLDCSVGYLVAMYRPGDAPDPSVPGTTPVPVIGNSPFDQVPPDDYSDFPEPPYDPDDPNSAWQIPYGGPNPTTPPTPGSPPTAEFDNRFARYGQPGQQGPLNDVRRDQSTNFRLVRGETVKLMIFIRNNTARACSPATPKNVYFRGLSYELVDRSGIIASGAFGSDPGELPVTDFIVGHTGQPIGADGLLLPAGTVSNVDDNDVYALIDFTVPETANGYINFRALNLEFCVGSPCATPEISAEPDNYVALVGGPLATAQIDIAGPETGRSIGEDAWFVIELTNLLGTAPGLKDPAVQTVSDAGGTLAECRTTGAAPAAGQGWYRIFDTPFVDLGTVPLPFTPSGTLFDYASGARDAEGTGVANMNLVQNSKIYCAFRRQLVPNQGANFVLDANLVVTGYPIFPGESPLTYTVNVNKTIPLGVAAIRVDKTIIGPLVQPPEIDPVTGEPRIKNVVNVGETVTYEVTVTNIGEVALDTITLNDSLIGPFAFNSPPINPEDSPGVCTNVPCSVSINLTYVVLFSDPNPIQNVVEARAEIIGTNFGITAQDVASILKAESELQLVLTTATPPGNDGFQPGEVITYQLQYCNTGTATLNSVEFLSGYPTRFDTGSTAGTLQFVQPGYPIVRQYLDNPPIVSNFSAPPFLPSSCGTINFNYTIPNYGSPLFRDPIFQDIRMRATRQDSSVIFGNVSLVTPLTNNNVSIEAVLFDPATGQPRADTTVLRGENLMFDLVVTNLSATRRCNVQVNFYRLNTLTGVETLIGTDLPMNWPAVGNNILDRLVQAPNNEATTLPEATGERDVYRPQFLVDGSTTDPLVLIFEVNAREDCDGAPPSDQFIARQALVLDVTDVQIATTLEVRNRTTNAKVLQGFYPRTSDITDYKIFFAATNVGPATMTINKWSYCILSSPNSAENCTSQSNEIDMLDGSDTTGAPGTLYPDFGVDPNNTATRLFPTLQSRVDQRAFTLSTGLNYPNPLIIQVVIRGVDNRGNNVVIRESITLPLITGDLNLALVGPTTLVRGDTDVPIEFGYANQPTGGELQNIKVLNLMEEDDTNGVSVPPGLGFDTTKYELCNYAPALGGGTNIASIPAGDTSVKSGICNFTFSEGVPVEGGLLRFRAAVIATEASTGQSITDIRELEIQIVPHLLMLKTGSNQASKTDVLPYTLIITNQSAFQTVTFPPDSFSDVFSPTPDGTICVIPGGSPCPPTLSNFTNLSPSGGNFVLSENGVATLNYQVNLPPIGQHTTEGYSNFAQIVGNRESDTQQVTASAGHTITLTCPIVIGGFYDLSHPDTTTTDAIFTVGEAVRIIYQLTNLSGTDLTFSSFQDFRLELDENKAMQLTDITWPTPTVGLVPAGGTLSYSYTLKIRPTDYLELVGEGEAPATPNNGNRGQPILGNPTAKWRIYYETQLSDPPGSKACYDSDPAHFWVQPQDVINPVQIDKTADRGLGFTGQIVNYSVSIYNVSEQVDIFVTNVDDSLLGGNIAMAFPGGTGISGTLPLDLPSSLPTTVNSQGPLARAVVESDPKELVNTATVNFRAAPGGPTWLYTAFEDGKIMSNSDFVRLLTETPLKLNKQVLVPTNGIAARGATVEYLITLINDSAFPVINTSLTDSRLAIPACNPPTLVEPRCLNNADDFTMNPGSAISLILSYVIPTDPDIEPGPSVSNTATAVGTLVTDSGSFALPQITATASVSLTAPALTIVPSIYAPGDTTCSLQKLVDITTPVDRDRNNDGIPEATVIEQLYYRFDIFVGGGKTFRDIQITANLQNGDATLTNNAQIALENHPNIGLNTSLADNINNPPEVPEMTLCIPYTIQQREPDPLTLIASLEGNDGTSNNISIADPLPVDVGDPNVFISKTTDRIVAFPGQEVTYTILIENKSGFPLEINDVYDERLGGQLFEGDPPVPLNFWKTGSPGGPLSTSIDFTAPNQATDGGIGWAWPSTVGRLEAGESVTYIYKKTILTTDPDPLLNRAGVLVTVKRPIAEGGDVQASDETINSLAITNSQLRVTKSVVPTATILGSTVQYTVSVANIGEEPVYDIRLFDDRYELQYAGATKPATPLELFDGVNGVQIIGGDDCNVPGQLNDLGPLGASFPCSGDPIIATYTLPTPPACVRWNGSACDPFDTPNADLLFIDPFINTAVATGKIEDPNAPGSFIDLLPPGSDSAIVDLINPGLRIEKTSEVGGASIGSDVTYTVRIINTGDVYVRINEVIDVPDANIPQGSTTTTQLPITSLTFEDCPVPDTVQTNPSGETNLQGTQLVPFSVGGIGGDPANTPIEIDNTAILLPGCSALATIRVQVPNPFPNNEYVNVVQVNGVDGTGEAVTDLSSATIDIRSAGIDITKRAWSCDTAPDGINTPPVIGGTQCTINTGLASAQQLTVQDEGRFVYYELTLVNSGTDAFNRLIIRDEMLVNDTPMVTPGQPNGVQYIAWNWRTNAPQLYDWVNGVLTLTDQTPNAATSYTAGNYPADWGDGPFGPDDLATLDKDESAVFEPGELFERPDPGPVNIPVITYRHTLELPRDESERITGGTEPIINYINRATVTGSADGVTPITNSSDYLLRVRPAQLRVELEGCVDEDNNPATPHDWNGPCNDIAQVEDALGLPQPAYIWYRTTLTNSSDTISMQDITVTDTVRGSIPSTDLCWDSNPGGSWTTQGILPPNSAVICTYVRDDSFTPLTTSDDPYINTVTANFTIGGASPGNPGTDSATIRITRGALLLSLNECTDVIQRPGGTVLRLNVQVENINPTSPITNLEIYVPDINTGQPTLVQAPPAPTSLNGGQQANIVDVLEIEVPIIGPATNEYTVSAFGQFLGNAVTSTATCTVQRVNGDLAVTKEVINPATGNAIAQPGDVVTYTITVENLGGLTITDLVVTDPRLPAANPAWPTELQGGQSVSRTFDYTVPAGEDPILNTVTVQGTAGVTQLNAQDEAQLTIADGDIVVTASANPSPVFAGSSTTLSYELCNLSSTLNYEISDFSAAIVGLVNPVTSPITDAQNNPITVPFVLNGLQCLNVIQVVPTNADDTGATLRSTIYAEGQDTSCAPGCANTVSDSQNIEVLVIDPNAAIVVQIDANRPTVTNGDQVFFTVTVTNLHPTNSVRLDTIDDTLDLFDGSTAFVNQTLLGGQSISYTHLIAYDFTGTPDPLTNQVTVDYTVLSSGLIGDASDDISIPVVSQPGATLIVQIVAPQTSTPGAELTYRYDVTNIGTSTVSDGYIDSTAITPPPGCTTITPNDWAAGGAANLIPSMPIGMTRSATIVCDVSPAFPINTDLIHTVEVYRTGAAPTLQDNDTRNVRIVPPLEIAVEQVNVAVPGGFAYFRYTLENIGPTVLSDVTLEFASTDLTTCDSAQTSSATTWTTNPFGTDTALNLFTTGQTFAEAETLVATIACFVPVTFLDANPPTIPAPLLERTFTHSGDVAISSVVQDSASVQARVIQPIEFTLQPQNTPSTVTERTQGALAPTFLRAEDTTRLVIRLRNVGPPGFSAEGVNYSLNFADEGAAVPGSTLFCLQQTVITSWGGAFANRLENPGDYIDIVCDYRPLKADAGRFKIFTASVTHDVNGAAITVPVLPNPLMRALVEYLELVVTLQGTPNTQNSGESRVDDGDTVQYTLTLRNNSSASVSLSNFVLTQSIVDLDTGLTVDGSSNFLTPGNPVHTLTDLWNANTNANGARCPDPLAPGQQCVISGAVPLHLIQTTDMNHVVVGGDPNRYEVRVVVEARSQTGSGLTATGTGAWKTIVQRPVVRIGGPNTSTNKDQAGNTWIYVPSYITLNPNPGQVGKPIQISVQIENAGFKNLFTPRMTGQISLLPTASADGYALTGVRAYQTPPTNLNFTITPTTLRRGEITTATATWNVEGITAPTTVYLRLNFQADVEGSYPDYNFVTPPISIPIVADPTARTTTADGTALDPNATEPLVTKTASVESAQPGEPVTWTITVTNGSTAIMPNVTLVDAVPGDLELISASTTAGASIVTGNLVDVTIGDLDPGEAATLTINTNIALTASVPGIITNTAVAQREGGTQVSAEASVGVGTTSDANPATGIGLTYSTPPVFQSTGWAKRLPFLLAISSVFVFMMLLNVSLTNRQRLILAVLAIGVVALLIGGLLLISSGEGDEEAPPTDGTPVDEAQIFPTATPLPSETPILESPTPEPTVPPDALATIQAFPPTATPYILPTQAGPRRLSIPALNYSIPVPIVELPLINQEWDVSNLGHNIGWLDKTTWFDPAWGNTVLVGHVQLSNTEPGPFENLDTLVPGDDIYVYEGDLVREFKVTEIFIAGAGETEVTHPTTDPILTLITCTNWIDSRGIFADRLVVKAVPAESYQVETADSGS